LSTVSAQHYSITSSSKLYYLLFFSNPKTYSCTISFFFWNFVTEECLLFLLQLLAYHVTVLRGFDVDQPRNLVKSVTTQKWVHESQKYSDFLLEVKKRNIQMSVPVFCYSGLEGRLASCCLSIVSGSRELRDSLIIVDV
jgi:hypothetical protein